MSRARRLAAEALGTAFLLAAVVGSGIMGEHLAQGNVAIALLANTLATGAALVVLILVFGPISGAHLNPVVTLSQLMLGRQSRGEAVSYGLAQVLGALAGVAAAHLMFGEPLFFASHHVRSGAAQWWSEFVASFGLLLVIHNVGRYRPGMIPLALGGYITAAYWFTASTSFANPAVTLARSLTDTFSGIRPVDTPGFIVAQIFGALAATLVSRWMFGPAPHPVPAEKPDLSLPQQD